MKERKFDPMNPCVGEGHHLVGSFVFENEEKANTGLHIPPDTRQSGILVRSLLPPPPGFFLGDALVRTPLPSTASNHSIAYSIKSFFGIAAKFPSLFTGKVRASNL